MVIRVDKCNECPLLNRNWGDEDECFYSCNHPDGIDLDIEEEDSDKMPLKCPLRKECISIRIK